MKLDNPEVHAACIKAAVEMYREADKGLRNDPKIIAEKAAQIYEAYTAAVTPAPGRASTAPLKAY